MLSVAAGIACAIGVGYLSLKVLFPWILKDVQYIRKVIPQVRKLQQMCDQRKFLVDIFEEKSNEQPDKILMIYDDKTYTYGFVNKQANRVARSAMKIGITRGQTVALMVHNEPAFVWTLLGFMKLGITIALINVNQRSKTLLHSLMISRAKFVIVGEGNDLRKAVAEIANDIPEAVVYIQGCSQEKLPKNFESFHDIMSEMSPENVDKDSRKEVMANDPAVLVYTSGTTDSRKDVMANDPAVLVYTSGTTGLPKAANVSQKKLIMGIITAGSTGANSLDMYMIPLPLYHSSALILGLATVIIYGASMILCRKFSASNFWNICRKHKATRFLYIGELCRYLLARPPSELDKEHSIKVAVGNGLRKDIFQDFQRRFGIPWIAEFYGATEGPLGFVNCLNVPSSCGRHSPILNKLLYAEFVKFDSDKAEPIRDENGLCIPVKRNENGLLLVKLTKLQVFEGYKGREDLTESRLVRNVIQEGDKYFNTGDIMILGEEFDLYFNDRLGDTFRWKGENVSTTEVSNILTDLDFITDACVYGVTIPGHDGKAGMAALMLAQEKTTLDEDDLLKLSQHCAESFPRYEKPLFVRICNEFEMTSTFKQNKVQFKKEGFDTTQVQDDLFYYDNNEKTYTLLTHEIYKKIINEKINM